MAGELYEILRQTNAVRAPHRCPHAHVKELRSGDVDITTCELDVGHEGPCRRGRKKWPTRATQAPSTPPTEKRGQ